MRVVPAVVPMEPETSRARPQENVVRVLRQNPDVAIEDPGLDETKLSGRESAPTWVRQGDDDRLRVSFLARDVDLAQATERAFDSRDPLVQLLLAKSGHACVEADRCSAAMSRQIWSLSALDSSRRVAASFSPSSSMSALSGTR